MLELSCREVLREISNYIDRDVDPDLRKRMEAHLAMCDHCTAILDGARNVIEIVGDGKTFILPADFSRNLYSKLAGHLQKK